MRRCSLVSPSSSYVNITKATLTADGNAPAPNANDVSNTPSCGSAACNTAPSDPDSTNRPATTSTSEPSTSPSTKNNSVVEASVTNSPVSVTNVALTVTVHPVWTIPTMLRVVLSKNRNFFASAELMYTMSNVSTSPSKSASISRTCASSSTNSKLSPT